jgi:hypothetical protein
MRFLDLNYLDSRLKCIFLKAFLESNLKSIVKFYLFLKEQLLFQFDNMIFDKFSLLMQDYFKIYNKYNIKYSF